MVRRHGHSPLLKSTILMRTPRNLLSAQLLQIGITLQDIFVPANL
jgi:hypothetical protein